MLRKRLFKTSHFSNTFQEILICVSVFIDVLLFIKKNIYTYIYIFSIIVLLTHCKVGSGVCYCRCSGSWGQGNAQGTTHQWSHRPLSEGPEAGCFPESHIQTRAILQHLLLPLSSDQTVDPSYVPPPPELLCRNSARNHLFETGERSSKCWGLVGAREFAGGEPSAVDAAAKLVP